MLRELSVQNMALIEDVRVELQPGFCAWSGETGAGKTLLLSALGLLVGDRGSAELIRDGAKELRVVGRFELAPASRAAAAEILQADVDEDDLILLRRLTRAGRSYAYANDQPVTLASLRQLGEMLVDVHGQRESHSLLQPAYQLQLLDAFGDLGEQREDYRRLAENVRSLRRELEQHESDRQFRARELALVRFEKEELDTAALVPGELKALLQQRERLAHAQAIQEFALSACGRLYDQDGSVYETLGKLQRAAEGWSRLDPTLTEVASRLGGLAAETQDLAQTLRPLGQPSEAPQRGDEIESRVQLLRRLETKYGRSCDELMAYRAELDRQEKKLATQEEDRAELEGALQATWPELLAVASELSNGRRKAARRLGIAVEQHLAELGMPDAHLQADLQPSTPGEDPHMADVPADGFEHLELMLSPNRGEPAWPLRKVASGGELSRTMLALKTVLAEHDPARTLIFDEIDANVGGRLGDVLGAKLAALGKTHQVLCVTHLPQVASYARHQWTIRKHRRGKRTLTSIEYLDDAARVEELASMLRGSARGETTRKEAEAMLEAARGQW